MATIVEKQRTVPQSAQRVRTKREAGLQVSAYDQVSGMLLSVLMILSCMVALMVVIWWSSRTWLPTPALEVMVLEDVGGGGQGVGGGTEVTEPNFEEPAVEELTEVTPPKVEDLIDAISLETTTQQLEEAELTITPPSSSWGNGKGNGQGDGVGDGSGPGTKAGTPAWERWEVRLNVATPDEYKKQLDFFKIELAVAGGGSPVVTYVTNVSTTPKVRTGKPIEEKRLRFMHRSGALRKADQAIVSKAGVDPSGKLIMQFYAKETYDTLLTLENIAMKPRSISDVRRTVFGVRGSAGKYEFYVISQDYKS
jgi:hypothetical protein